MKHSVPTIFLILLLGLTHKAIAADVEVTTTVDENDHSCSDGDCSLRDAIELAQTGNNIVLQAATYTLTLGQISVPNGVTLTGKGASSTILQAAASPGTATSRVMEINGTVIISDLTVRHGRVVGTGGMSVIGGGIVNRGMLTLRRCTITDNQAIGFSNASGESGSAQGGGIHNSGMLTMDSCIVSNNLAVGGSSSSVGGGGNGSGGGIYSSGSMILLIATTIESNRAEGGSATINAGVALGGGIDSETTSPAPVILTLDRCTVRNNNAKGGTGSIPGYALGGGIRHATAALGEEPILSTLTLLSSNISGNAVEAQGDAARGGGLFQSALQLEGAAGTQVTTTLLNCTFSGNSASAGTGVASGGGISNQTFPPASAANSSASVTLGNTTFAQNSVSGSAGSAGGGIYNGTAAGAEILLRNSIVAGNSASTGPDCSGTLTSEGYNLLQNTAGCTLGGSLTGNITGQEPKLGELQDHGGPTETRALDPDSPAIDKGNPAPPGSGGNACEILDQRGFVRPVDGPDSDPVADCDMGAHELGAMQPTATPTSTATPTGTPTATQTPVTTSASPPHGSWQWTLLLLGIVLLARQAPGQGRRERAAS